MTDPVANQDTEVIQSVDIAICTWNRHRLLSRTLESITRLEVPDSIQLTLLLVDNASTDATQTVLEKFGQSDFVCRHAVSLLHEKQQGHTFSRNCAINASQSDLILWTDDDVLLPTNWIQGYVDAANRQPDSTFWGGCIEPEFEGGTPDWIEANWENVRGCFAARDLGSESIEFNARRLPYGANFAVRGTVQRQFLFSTELGRQGEAVLGEDELDLMRRLLDQGMKGHWVPGIPVKHLIPKSRATIDYVRGYFVGQGRALVQKGTPWHDDVRAMQQEARSEKFAYWWKRFFFKPEVWVSHLIRSALADGQAQFLKKSQY